MCRTVRNIFLLGCFAVLSLKGHAQVPTEQDCLGAIPLCSDSITVAAPYPYFGGGNYLNEINQLNTCYSDDNNCVWYTFTIQQAGLLRFSLTPTLGNTDFDWTLYDITTATCADLATLSASALMQCSNTWGAFGFNGPTGISTPNGGAGTCNGPGTLNGPQWNADLPVTAGTRYVLCISNWSSLNTGYTLDFSASTAVLFDDVPPEIDTIVSNIECASFDSISIRFSENLVCDSVQVGDFALTGPGGAHTITSVAGYPCSVGADYGNTYTVYFAPPVTQLGNYTLSIVPGAGFVEDLCGNLDTLDSIGFTFNGSVDIAVSGTDLTCYNECTGTLHAQAIGGTGPFAYDWAGLPTDSVHTGVCADTFHVTITDAMGCTATDSIILNQPPQTFISIDTLYNISCPGETACNGGAEVSASGGTPPYSYLWATGDADTSSNILCSGANWVTVTDGNGCIDSLPVNIMVPFPIETIGYGDTTICITNPASIIAASTGGTQPFSYAWREGSLSGPIVSTHDVDLVYPTETTTYFVSSTDVNGCAGDTADVVVTVRPPLGNEIIGQDTICPYDTIKLSSEPTGGDSIYFYVWENGSLKSFTNVSPDVSSYVFVTISDKCGTPSFTDSVWVQVGGYPGIKAKIGLEDDSLCLGDGTYMTANATGGFRGPAEFQYAWADGLGSSDFIHVAPKTTTTYVVTITDLCLSKPGVDSVTVYVGPYAKPAVYAEPAMVCTPGNTVISLEDFNPDYTYNWNLGDGTTEFGQKSARLSHDYAGEGCYDVSVELITDFGCVTNALFPCLIQCRPTPVADFGNDPSRPTTTDPIVEFMDASIGAANLEWLIDGRYVSSDPFFAYTFPESGDFSVQLIAINDEGCADTISKLLHADLTPVIYFPTSFTPNGDGLNDVFGAVGEGISKDGFELTVYDRWGRVLFRTANPKQMWDGKDKSGKGVPIATYPYTVKYLDEGKNLRLYNGQVTVSKRNERIDP